MGTVESSVTGSVSGTNYTNSYYKIGLITRSGLLATVTCSDLCYLLVILCVRYLSVFYGYRSLLSRPFQKILFSIAVSLPLYAGRSVLR